MSSDVTSNLRLKVRKCLQNKGIDPENPPQDELKKCADGVSQEKDPKDKSNSLYGGSFTPDDIISIYNDKLLLLVIYIHRFGACALARRLIRGRFRTGAVGGQPRASLMDFLDSQRIWYSVHLADLTDSGP